MFIIDKLETIKRALLSSFFNNKEADMAKSNTAVGSKYFKGTGKTFTLDGLREQMNIASPGARVSEIRDAGFNVKSKTAETGYQGRPALEYTISRRRVTA